MFAGGRAPGPRREGAHAGTGGGGGAGGRVGGTWGRGRAGARTQRAGEGSAGGAGIAGRGDWAKSGAAETRSDRKPTQARRVIVASLRLFAGPGRPRKSGNNRCGAK